MNRSIFLLPSAIAAALALAACSPRDESTTAGQKTGEAVTTARSGAQEAKRDAKEAGDKATSGVADATITTKINAALAADDKLKATKIDVDTSNGRVVLTGKAPDPASRDRATMLAQAVEGVVQVDNRLSVEGKG